MKVFNFVRFVPLLFSNFLRFDSFLVVQAAALGFDLNHVPPVEGNHGATDVLLDLNMCPEEELVYEEGNHDARGLYI